MHKQTLYEIRYIILCSHDIDLDVLLFVPFWSQTPLYYIRSIVPESFQRHILQQWLSPCVMCPEGQSILSVREMNQHLITMNNRHVPLLTRIVLIVAIELISPSGIFIIGLN